MPQQFLHSADIVTALHLSVANVCRKVQLPADAKVFPEYYEAEQVWSPGSLERRRILLPLIKAYQASRRSPT